MATWMGHLGPDVADLLDGRMSRDEEDRAWAHVHGCSDCQDLVTREGWIKSRLCGMSSAPTASSSLKGCLLQAPTAFAATDADLANARLDDSGLRRSFFGAAAVIGGGAAGAAVVGVLALGISPAQAPASVERRVPANPTSAINTDTGQAASQPRSGQTPTRMGFQAPVSRQGER